MHLGRRTDEIVALGLLKARCQESYVLGESNLLDLGEMATLDGFIGIFLGIVGRFVEGFFLGEELSVLWGNHVKLAVHPFALLMGDLECVAIIAAHEAVAIYQ